MAGRTMCERSWRTPNLRRLAFHAEAIRALAAPDIRQIFEPAGVEIVGGTPEELAAKLRHDTDLFAKVARTANIRVE